MQAEALPLGGFFALEPPASVAGSVWARWSGSGDVAAFRNARSALAAALRAEACRRLLLPAYICDSVVEAGLAAGCELAYYPLAEGLVPDMVALQALAPAAGDAVLVVDYFGRAPGSELRMQLLALPCLLIEDCAQALDPGLAPWADWRIYSPRKLLGVADGGLLCRGRSIRPLPQPGPLAAVCPPLAPLLRFEDPQALAGAHWYGRYQEEEAQQAVSMQPMSRWSRAVLDSVALSPLAEARRCNYRRYQAALANWSLLGELTDFVPMGFVFQHAEAGRIWRVLVEHKIFAPRHWPNLPSPVELFPAAHALAAELITLPVDHRLNEHDVDRVVEHVVSLL